MEKVYVRALRRSGRKQEAEAEFDKLLRMHPDQAEALQKWWTGG